MTLTEFERQSLRNQLAILNCVNRIMVYSDAVNDSGDMQRENIKCFKETEELLSQEKSEEPCCEMPDYALSKDGEKEVSKNEN